MAEHPNRDPVGAAASDVGAIEKGWSVHDSLDRPIGNVTDVEGGKLVVDGRPQSLGFFEVSLETVQSAADGEVHLSVQMESIPTPDATTPSRPAMADEETPPPIIGGFDAEGSGPATPSQGSATSSASRSESLDGSSYTASGTPIGLGSNTPVGNEPQRFRAWEDEEPYRESTWSRYGTWLGVLGLGLAGVLGLLWWRRRQARRRPIERVRAALGSAGESVGRVREAIGSAGESVEPIWEGAVERKRAWGLALLAALPLLLWARSSKEAGGSFDTAPDRRPDTGDLKGRLSSLRLSQWRESDREANPDDESSVLWWAGVPAIVGALAAAWYATRRDSAGKTRRLGQIMTSDVEVVRPETTAFEVASTMKHLDVGALPVCDGRRLLGMVTDRDIVVRAVAEGRDPRLISAQDVMTKELIYAQEDDAVQRGADLMRRHQIRRLPIVDRQKQLVGIVSLGDLAVDLGDDHLSGATLEQVSKPGR